MSIGCSNIAILSTEFNFLGTEFLKYILIVGVVDVLLSIYLINVIIDNTHTYIEREENR